MKSIRYTVHSVSEHEAEVDAIVAGESVRAKIPMTIVECLSEDGSMGHTFRFRGDDDGFFVKDQVVDVSFTEVSRPEPIEAPAEPEAGTLEVEAAAAVEPSTSVDAAVA